MQSEEEPALVGSWYGWESEYTDAEWKAMYRAALLEAGVGDDVCCGFVPIDFYEATKSDPRWEIPGYSRPE